MEAQYLLNHTVHIYPFTNGRIRVAYSLRCDPRTLDYRTKEAHDLQHHNLAAIAYVGSPAEVWDTLRNWGLCLPDQQHLSHLI